MLYFLKTGFTNVRRYRMKSLIDPMAEYFSDVNQDWVTSEFREGVRFYNAVLAGQYLPADATSLVGKEDGKKFILKKSNRGGMLVYSPCVKTLEEIIARGPEWIPIGELSNPWTQIEIGNLIRDGYSYSAELLVT